MVVVMTAAMAGMLVAGFPFRGGGAWLATAGAVAATGFPLGEKSAVNGVAECQENQGSNDICSHDE
jgi:hypothetical protein